MTPRQIELARHALGLNRRHKSYRNYFVADPRHDDYRDWLEMVEKGYAVRRSGDALSFGGDDVFHVTKAGAEIAVKFGGKLEKRLL